jgi:DNA-directed RNA polymerase specialized sigma24 family protein
MPPGDAATAFVQTKAASSGPKGGKIVPTDQHAFDQLLASFISGDTDFAATAEFRKISAPVIRGLARRFGPDLPADLIDEVVSESYVLLLGNTGKNFQVSRGSAQKFLFGVVANAVKNVRAGYRPPAVPSRPRRKDTAADQPTIVPFDEVEHSTGSRLLPDVHQADAALYLETVLAGITAVMAAAIIATYVHGEQVNRVASTLGVSRFQIRRVMQKLRTIARTHRGRRQLGQRVAA